mmetsp:Transcript_43109/g.107955  ORF Transcript_43109/g.107955 Transcript_43109/m.107955 type:complete len:103 (+) Transcript_43109:168-476(+)
MACAQAVAQLYASPLLQEGCLDGLLPCLADLATCREPSGADRLVAVQCALQCLAYVCEAAPGRLSKVEIDQVCRGSRGGYSLVIDLALSSLPSSPPPPPPPL